MRLCKNHPSRKVQARGLCKNCYDKWLKTANPAYRQKQLANSKRWADANRVRLRGYSKKYRKAITKLKETDYQSYRDFRDARRAQGHGLTLADLRALEEKSGNKCELCGRSPNHKKVLHIDHSHKTGAVRGLLCHQCNWYLGTVEAAEFDLLKKIRQYLKRGITE